MAGTGNCWKVLGIHPTNDVETIKKAYRALIRKWHPDRVRSPEQKPEFTDRCAEINVAYDEAMNLARGWAPGRAYPPAEEPIFAPARQYRYNLDVRVSSTLLACIVFLTILSLLGPFRLVAALLAGFGFAFVLNLFLRTIVRRVVRLEREIIEDFILFGCDVLTMAVAFPAAAVVFKLGILLAVPIRVVRRISSSRKG
jgi:hypothetical protein